VASSESESEESDYDIFNTQPVTNTQNSSVQKKATKKAVSKKTATPQKNVSKKTAAPQKNVSKKNATPKNKNEKPKTSSQITTRSTRGFASRK